MLARTSVPTRTVATFESRVAKQTRTAKRGARVSARAFDDVNITISAANALALSLGRYVFLPYQRAQVERVGLPTQNGETHFDAGDARAKEASFITTTKDPAGFTLVDLLAWGSIGHALGFLALASQSAQQML